MRLPMSWADMFSRAEGKERGENPLTALHFLHPLQIIEELIYVRLDDNNYHQSQCQQPVHGSIFRPITVAAVVLVIRVFGGWSIAPKIMHTFIQFLHGIHYR